MSTAPSRPWALLALAVVASLAALDLAMPLGGDQANFLLGARVLAAGGALYVDYWEINQPGIFVLYGIAGRLFGHAEIGVHAFEALWQLTLAGMLLATLRTRFTTGWAWALASVLAVGIYLAVASDWHLTQKEALAGLPLYAVLWSAVRAVEDPERRTRWLALSGAVGGLALVLKLLFAPVIASFWLVAAVAIALRERPLAAPRVARWSGALAAGVTLPVALTVARFALTDRLDELLWVSFVVPPLTIAEGAPPDLGRLVEAGSWYARHYGGATLLAALGAWTALRRRLDPLVVGCVAWIVTGALVYLVQRTSWWAYHVLLVMVPVGILAALGVEALVAAIPARRGYERERTLIGVALLLVATIVVSSARRVVRKGLDAAQCSFDARCFQDRQSPFYAGLRAEAEWLARSELAGESLYVAGNPALYHLSGELPAVGVHGWNFEANPRVVNERFVRELEAARPGALFVDALYDGVLEERAPAVFAAIEGLYEPLRVSEAGRWYRPRAPAPAPAAPPAATGSRS